MEKNFLQNDETETGLTDSQIQWVARRQFVGSLIVAAMIAVVAALIATAPAHQETASNAPAKIGGVRQPTFVTPDDHFAGVIRHGTELP